MSSSEKTLLTQRKAATYLDVSVATLIEWRKKGYIRAHKIASRVFYFKEELDFDIQNMFTRIT